MLHESLWRAWSVQKRAVPISPAMYFSSDGLALGAGTILLPAVGPRRLADLQGEEARLLALLSATYGKAISPSVLGKSSIISSLTNPKRRLLLAPSSCRLSMP